MNETLESQLRAIFREEAAELLGELRAVVSALRDADSAELTAQVSTAMRLAHNLKGAASNVGLGAVERGAHAMEEGFLRLRQLGPAALGHALPLLSDTINAVELAAEERGDALAVAQETRLMAWAKPSLQPGAAMSGSPKARAPEDVAAAPEPAPLASDNNDNTKNKVRTIRIETERLDSLLEFASELIVAGTDMRRRHEQLVELRRSFDHKGTRAHGQQLVGALRFLDSLIQENRQAVSAFDRLSGNLHDSMRRARMVRLDSQVSSMRRTVDDAARTLQKAVDLETDFSNVELDKAVLDLLRDPIVHLLRNAIDHGVESAQSRALLGKPERALVRASARVRGNTVELLICDDGSGIDVRRVAATAVTRGLLSAAEAERAEPAAILDFIFAEGFSTRDKATRLSGRGIGLDVVKRAIRELGGSVRALARGPLGGAAFELTIPLSLLSARLLLVRCNEAVYAVPVQSIDRVVKVPRTAVQTLEDVQVVKVSDSEVLRVRWLAQLVSTRAPRDSDQLKLLIVSYADAKLALAVDEILHEEALVVRRLPWNLVHVAAVSGAALLADGSVAVVLDATQLATRRHVTAPRPKPHDTATRILVVDDSMTTRTLHRNVLTFAGYNVVVAHDGNDAWELLRSEDVDVIVSDVQMPGMDGFELTRRVRADARLKNLTIVLVTSLDQPEDVQRGRDAGADEYVVKGPLERDALLSAVARHFR
jgi:two-component system chemotaxis sensor kinase CheA